MKQTAGKTTTRLRRALRPGDSPLSGLMLAVQLLDITWRVAIPILVLSLLGASLDRRLHTKPILTLVGLLLAIATSSFLVYKQIKLAFPDFVRKKDNKS